MHHWAWYRVSALHHKPLHMLVNNIPTFIMMPLPTSAKTNCTGMLTWMLKCDHPALSVSTDGFLSGHQQNNWNSRTSSHQWSMMKVWTIVVGRCRFFRSVRFFGFLCGFFSTRFGIAVSVFKNIRYRYGISVFFSMLRLFGLRRTRRTGQSPT